MKNQNSKEKSDKVMTFKDKFKLFLYDMTQGMEYMPGARPVWLGYGLVGGALLVGSFLAGKYKLITVPLALANIGFRYYQMKSYEEIVIEHNRLYNEKIKEMMKNGQVVEFGLPINKPDKKNMN